MIFSKLPPPNSTNTQIASLDSIGAPNLPVFIQSFVLPAGSILTGIQITPSQQTTFTGNPYIRPAQPPCIIGQACDTVPPNPAIYNSANPYPAQHIKVIADRYIFNYHVVTVQICPFEYIPVNRKLSLFQQLNFNIQYTQGTNTHTDKSSPKMTMMNFDFIKSMMANPQDPGLQRPSTNPSVLGVANKRILHWQPDDIGDQPDYVIVTNNALKPYFQILADYKIKRGIPTVIATVEDIYQSYPGVDYQEQIRNYLKDVFQNWGSIYVLLGGDTNIIPARIGLKEGIYYRITDLYYSDIYKVGVIDYNWNSNGNGDFGWDEISQIDRESDIYLGRLSVKNITELDNIIQKIIRYENATNLNTNYIKNLLMLGAYSSYNHTSHTGTQGGQNDIHSFHINTPFLDNSNKYFLLDDHQNYSWANNHSDELNKANTLNKLNSGNYQFIIHIDHSYPYAIGVSSEMKANLLQNNDADNLQNNNNYQIMYTNGCEPGMFDKDCFAEHYINSQSSGGIAIVANTGFGYWGQTQMFVNFMSELTDNDKSGILGNAFYASQINNDPSNFTQVFKRTLFGDPSMMVWTDTPQNITLTVPQNVTIDNSTNNPFVVQLNSLSHKADITVYKYNNVTQQIEIYASQTAPAGQTSTTFYLHPDTEGQLLVTATAKNYLPATATSQIHLPQAHLYITNVSFTDSNGNNAIEPGENISLNITLTNSGNTDISNISAHLHPDDALLNQITVTQADNSYTGTIASGNSIRLSNYQFHVNTNGALPHYLKFWLDIADPNGYSHSDEFYLDMAQAGIEKGTHFIKDNNNNYVEPPNMSLNQTYDFFIKLVNTGDVEQTGVSGVLSSTSSDIEIIQNTGAYNTIKAHHQQLNNTAYRIKLINTPANQSVPLTLTVANALGLTTSFNFNLFDAYPNIISGYHFTSTDNSITLLWEPLRNGNTLVPINGYNIYRSATIDGTYEKVNDRLISGSSIYTDNTVDPTSTYYYKISVVSPTNLETPLDILLTNPADYNNGVAVQGYKAWTVLPTHQGYPITHTLNVSMKNSPTVFDVNGDGYKEVFSQAMNWETVNWYGSFTEYGGRIFAYNHQGHELFNIDGNTTNIEGFALTRQQIFAKSAIFDLDKDGHADIFTIDRKNGDISNINAFKTIDTHNDAFDRPDHFWDYPDYSNQVINYHYYTLIPPVIADLNNDGFNEVISLDEMQKLHIFDKNKQELYNYQITSTHGYNKMGMAVGDIDNNGYKDVVYVVQENNNLKTAIYASQYNGNSFQTRLIKEISNTIAYNNNESLPKIILGDINNDNILDITCYVKTSSTSYRLFAFDQNGNAVDNWSVSGIRLTNPKGLSLGQINNDDFLEVVVTDRNHIKVFNYNGQLIHDIQTSGILRDVPILADIDNTNDIEIIINEDKYLNAYKLDGTVVSGWGMASLSERFEGSPVISPLDDNKNCVIVNDNYSTIYAWNTTGDSNKIEWGSARRNAQNTACYSKLDELDLTVKDGIDDSGLEPNTVTQYLWTSSDIWIRNNDDNGTEHENPEYDPNNPVYVYVRVTNRSNVASTGNELLHLYWGKARTDLFWPRPWTGYNDPQTGIRMGDEIGHPHIPILQPGESRIIKFSWRIPNPEDYIGIDPNPWHYCLLARIESLNDPMTYPETTDLVQNVKNNNNIAWKNVTVVNVVPNQSNVALTGTVAIGNMKDQSKMYYLELIKDPNEAGNPIFKEAEVKIKMDNTLYDAWERGGKIAEALKATNDDKVKFVKGNNVILDNIAFNHHEMGILTLTFNFLTEKMTNKDKFTYHLIQHDYQTGAIVGGETFVIKKQPRPVFIALTDDKEADKGDVVTLSAENINEAAVYNWYDMEGNLIYQGKDMTISTDMAKKYKLEVIATADGFKDYEEVEVKLKPNHIVNMTPNPANNQVNISYKINEGNNAYLMLINISGNNNNVGNYVLDLNTDNININISNYPTGIYSVVLVTDGAITDVKEMIKE